MSVDLRRVDGLIARAECKMSEQKARVTAFTKQGRDTRHAIRLLSMMEDGLTSFRSSMEMIVDSLRMLGKAGERI